MIGKLIRDIINQKKVTYRKIASDLGMDHGNLYHSLMNGANPEWKTIEKLLDYLGYDFKLVKRREVKPGKPNRQSSNELKRGGKFK
jgi:DNA-binding phage protein